MSEHREGMDILKESLFNKEDLPSDLRSIAQYYAAQPTPLPRPEQTEHLLVRLLAEETTRALEVPAQVHSSFRGLYIARWRLRLLGPWFWGIHLFLLFVLAIGILILGHFYAVELLVLVLPLTTILGFAHALHNTSSGLHEVEISCSIGIVETTSGLALAIIGLNCLIGCLGTVEIALLHWAPFIALFSTWFAPLVLFTALALLVTLRWGTQIAVLVIGLLWLFLVTLSTLKPDTTIVSYIISIPGENMSLLLHFCIAAIGGCVLLSLLSYGSRWKSLTYIR